MSWADAYIRGLERHGAVEFRPRGKSMEPLVKDGELVRVAVVPVNDVVKGDVVLCRVSGHVYLHRVTAVRGRGAKRSFQIGNNRGHINGWTKAIYGKRVPLRKE